MSERYDQLMRRYQAAKNESDMWQALHTDCYTYALPQRNTFITYSQGQRKGDLIFDATAPKAVFKFAANLQSALIPPGRKWCKLVPGIAIKKSGLDAVKKKLDTLTNEIFDYINNSNFAMASSEGLMDLAIGTCALLCNENDDDDNPFVFTAVPLSQISPEEGSLGTINTNWRRYTDLKARNIKQYWPNAKISANLESKIKNSPDDNVNIIEVCLYNPDANEDERYEYIVLDTDNKAELYSEKSPSSPWIIPRWSKVPGETFGRGPVMQVLSDIKTLNKMVEFTLTAAAMVVAPPYLASNDDVFNPYTLELEPNIIIPIEPLRGPNQLPLMPLPRNGDPQFGNLLVGELRSSINDALFIDALGPVGGPQMSATEVYTRSQMLMKTIGSAFGRLQVELLAPVIDRVIYILMKRGLIEPVTVNGKEVTLKYQSPLAQAQNQDDINAFIQFIQIIAQATGKNAEQAALLALKVNKIPMFLGEKLGVPLELINSDADIESITKAAQQQMEQQQQQDFSLPQMQPQAPQQEQM